MSEKPGDPGAGETEPEDRLADLGARRREAEQAPELEDDGRSAADRLAELDITQPEEEPKQPGPPPRPSGIYNWVIGVAFLAVVVIVFFTVRDTGPGNLGPEPGDVLPDFAAASVTGNSDDDANIKQLEGAGDGTPACDVRDPANAVNICTIRATKPVVLTFAFTRAADCEPAFDVVERVRREFPQVAFVGVFSGEDHDKVRRFARERGWSFPIGIDPDGAVTSVYGVSGCPTTTFAYKGGEVKENELGPLGEDELRDEVRDLLRGKPSS